MRGDWPCAIPKSLCTWRHTGDGDLGVVGLPAPTGHQQNGIEHQTCSSDETGKSLSLSKPPLPFCKTKINGATRKTDGSVGNNIFKVLTPSMEHFVSFVNHRYH